MANKNEAVSIVDEFDVGFVNEEQENKSEEGAEMNNIENIARIEVSIDNDNGVNFNTVIADVVGSTEKNIKLGDNRGDLKVFVNKELIGEMTSNGMNNHVKWVMFEDEDELESEKALMFRDVARIVRAEEKEVMEKFKSIKNELREVVTDIEESLPEKVNKVAKKRGPGRPRKVETDEKTEKVEKVSKKRGPGRPRKVETDEKTEKVEKVSKKRGPGRPRKVETAEKVEKVSKKRGRPRKVQ